MRIIVLSDSHGRVSPLESALEAQPEASAAIFLGDGLREFERVAALYPSLSYYSAAGNCDAVFGADSLNIVNIFGKRILYTHGHHFGVKSGTGRLIDIALQRRAEIVLYGHTHIACTEYCSGLYLMNPGSVAFPRRGGATYGIIDITAAGVHTFIVALQEGTGNGI